MYLLLKSSDFVSHDLSPEHVFAGCELPAPDADTEKDTEEEKEQDKQRKYELELVLRKWYSVDRGREVRCFVRDGKLLGAFYLICVFYSPSFPHSYLYPTLIPILIAFPTRSPIRPSPTKKQNKKN